MASFHDLTTAQLKEALQIRERIEKLQRKLDALLGGTTSRANPGGPTLKPRKAGVGHGKIGAAPKWRYAHVRSPLDTLMDAAPEKTDGLKAEGRAKRSATRKKGASGLKASAA